MTLKRILTACCVAMTSAVLPSCRSNVPEEGQALIVGDDIAIASTQYGKVQGFIYDDVYHFLGIPYGASTAGENRFMPPVAPEPWDGVFKAFCYGDSAPQGQPNFSQQNFGNFRDHWNYGMFSEDCLRLNVWTPGLDSAKRPVIVWLHGGGFSAGNGIEHDLIEATE